MDEVDVNGNTAFHLAAMEGQLSCLKFLVSSTTSSAATKSVVDSLASRNDQGETPKMLAQQFYKENVVTYISGEILPMTFFLFSGVCNFNSFNFIYS